MLKRILRRMRQIFRMYRLVKIVGDMEVQVNVANTGKDLLFMLDNGYLPRIQAVKKKLEVGHKLPVRVVTDIYNDALDKGYITEQFDIRDNKKPLKLAKYVSVTYQGRSLTDHFIIPWGLLKACVVEYGVVVTLFVSLGLGALLSAIYGVAGSLTSSIMRLL